MIKLTKIYQDYGGKGREMVDKREAIWINPDYIISAVWNEQTSRTVLTLADPDIETSAFNVVEKPEDISTRANIDWKSRT
jgi:hypothetical protein